MGPAGAAVPGTGWLRMEAGRLPPSESKVSDMLVMKNTNPRMAVVRVSVLAAPRGENNPPRPEPPPPIPSAPPSERCSSTTQTSATATRR